MRFFLLLLPLVLECQGTLKKRCRYVDDGFVTKDCGLAPTTDELTEFFAKQAASLAELAISHPCGFTSCSKKFKRDLELDYGTSTTISAPLQKRDAAPHEIPLKNHLPRFPRRQRSGSVENSAPATIHRGGNALSRRRSVPEDQPDDDSLLTAAPSVGSDGDHALDTASPQSKVPLHRRDLNPPLHTRQEDGLSADNQAVGAKADGTLYIYGTQTMDPPARRDVNPPTEQDPLFKRQEDGLSADDQPVGAKADGTLYIYGTQTVDPPSRRDLTEQDPLFKRQEGALSADDQPVGAKADGTLYIYGTQTMDPPSRRDVNPPTEPDSLFKRQEDGLSADDQPVGAKADGTLYIYGTQTMDPPSRKRGSYLASSHDKRHDDDFLSDNHIRSTPDDTLSGDRGQAPLSPALKRHVVVTESDLDERDLIDEFLEEARLEKREEVERERQKRSIEHGNTNEVVTELIERGIELDEDELMRRNLPVTRGSDGKLHLFGARAIELPAKENDAEIRRRAETQDEWDKQIARRSENSDVSLARRAFVDSLSGANSLSESELIERNLPVGRDAEGNLYLYGTR